MVFGKQAAQAQATRRLTVTEMMDDFGSAPLPCYRVGAELVRWKACECLGDLIVAGFVLVNELLSFFSSHVTPFAVSEPRAVATGSCESLGGDPIWPFSA